MKFKNQKWIAREIGVDNWEGVEKDHCGTYQSQFYDDSFTMLSNSFGFYMEHSLKHSFSCHDTRR